LLDSLLQEISFCREFKDWQVATAGDQMKKMAIF